MSSVAPAHERGHCTRDDEDPLDDLIHKKAALKKRLDYLIHKKASFYDSSCTCQKNRPPLDEVVKNPIFPSVIEVYIFSDFILEHLDHADANTTTGSTELQHSSCWKYRSRVAWKAVDLGLIPVKTPDDQIKVSKLFTEHLDGFHFWFILDFLLRGSPLPLSIKVL